MVASLPCGTHFALKVAKFGVTYKLFHPASKLSNSNLILAKLKTASLNHARQLLWREVGAKDVLRLAHRADFHEHIPFAKQLLCPLLV